MKPIIYGPYLDSIIVKDLLEFAKKKDPLAEFELIPETSLHKKILHFPKNEYKKVPQGTDIFIADSIVGDHTAGALFKEFAKKNDFSLEIPIPPKPKTLTIFLTSAALMSLITKWPTEYRAKKHSYLIDEKESWNHSAFKVNGFQLSNVQIARYQNEPVSALLDLDEEFQMEFFTLDAFENGRELLRNTVGNFDSLLSLKSKKTSYGYKRGYMYCPSVDINCHQKDHLANLRLKNKNNSGLKTDIDEIIIDSSESLGKLELSEWGVRARVEVVAQSRILLGASINHDRPPVLEIKNGLVVKVLHKGIVLFIAYIPQTSFKKI